MTFRLHLRVDFGQSVSIIGNCRELGDWNNVRAARLEWSKGDLWETTIKLNQPFFQYKYAVVAGGHEKVRVEQGLNRIADLKLKDDMVFDDEWETYSVRFSIYYPMKASEIMRIQGDSL